MRNEAATAEGFQLYSKIVCELLVCVAVAYEYSDMVFEPEMRNFDSLDFDMHVTLGTQDRV